MRKVVALIGVLSILFLGVTASYADPGKWDSFRKGIRTLGTDILPAIDDTYDVGSATKEWQDGYFDGVVYMDGASVSGAFTTQGGIVMQGGTYSTQTLALPNGAAFANAVNDTVTLTENSDILSWVFDGSDIYQKWSDGSLYLQTDEGTDTQTNLRVVGKGTSGACVYGTVGSDSTMNYSLGMYNTGNAVLDFGSSVTGFVVNNSQATVDYTFKTKSSATALVVNSDATEGNEYIQLGLPKVFQNAAAAYAASGSTSVDGIEINNTSASGKFPVLALNSWNDTDATSAFIDFNKSGNNTVGSHTIVANNEPIAYLIGRGSDGTNFDQAAQIRMEVDGTPGAGADMPGRLTLWTSPDGSATCVERMRIDNAGQIQSAYMARNYQHDEIGILLETLTAPKAIVGFTGTGATTATESGYESGAGRVWTYSGGLAADKIFQGSTYVYSFDGTDSYLSTPDTADMTFALAAASWGGWVEITSSGSLDTIMARWNETTADPQREWLLTQETDRKLKFWIYDETNNGYSFRLTDTAVTAGWHHIAVTYDGAANAAGVVIYVDGILKASSATEDVGAAFDSMRDTSALTTLGVLTAAGGTGANWWKGDMGRLFVTGEALSAATIWKIYEKTRSFYAK